MFKLVRFWLTCLLLIASIPVSWAQAQTTYDPWAVPVNLSHSGIAVNPSIVIDSEGMVHAIWQDDLADFVYSRLDGDQWSTPETTNLNSLFRLPIAEELELRPALAAYTGPNPLFVAGANEDIFAFWISIQGKLFTSRVKNVGFSRMAAWDAERMITPGVASFAVAVDANGELHLTFMRKADAPGYPAGIYYARTKYNGLIWSLPVRLYESTYFRSLAPGEGNLSIATAGADDALHVYVAWDNRPRKQVFLARSTDGGKSWEQPALIAGPAPDSGSGGPFNIHVGTHKDSIVLFWQNGRPDGACSQIYQSSTDAGATWNDPQTMIEELVGCAQSNDFVAGLAGKPEGPLYVLTKTQSQVMLTAWNGRQWSVPQEQPVLASFEDPEIFSEVPYGCHRAALLGEQLYVIGCDQGGGGDVWVTSRDIGANTSLFSPPVWSQPEPVTDESLEMQAVELVVTDDDLIHAFFSQPRQARISYTYWDGESWSPITPVMKVPDGDASLSAVARSGNELFLIVVSKRGALYFSRATSGKAATQSSWSTPAQLGIEHEGEIGSVDIAWDTAGTIYVAYSVPVNEERGIYLVQSKDNGTSWSEPLRVFDGAKAGFDLIGSPSLLISENGFLHITWKQESIRGEGVPQPVALFYTRSEDGGHTFKEAERIVEEAVAWSEIVTDGEGHLHLLWQPQDTLATVWDQVSLDGDIWQYPQGLPDEGKLAAVTRDLEGRLHFLGVGPAAVGHWLWDGGRWQAESPLALPLSSQQESPVELLSAAVNKEGKMMVVFAERAGEGDTAEWTLLYSTRTLDLPGQQTAVQESPTETVLPPTVIPVTSTPESSPTLISTADSEPTSSQAQIESNETDQPISPVAMAILPVALLLLAVLGFVIRRANRVEDR